MRILLEIFKEPSFFFNKFRRYLVSIGLVLAAKVGASILIYYSLQLGRFDSYWMLWETGSSLPQNMVLHELASQSNRWLYLYVGWDSAWYLSIMSRGYRFSSQSYAFFPGLIIIEKILEQAFRNPLLSTFIAVFVFGIAWIPVFQLLAERRMSERNALLSTLLFAFSPYVFLFTTVMYTEGPFLFFTLLAWLYFERHEMSKAVFYASVSTLIKPVGFLIAAPLILYSLREEEGKKVTNSLKSLLPIVTLFGWFLYCKLSTGNWLASMGTSEWNNMYTVYEWITRVIPEYGVGALMFPIQWLNQHKVSPLFIGFFVVFPPLLLFNLLRTNKYAGIYSLIYYVSIVAIGTIFSYPRFLSFLFPIWMYGWGRLLNERNGYKICLIFLPIFFVISVMLWSGFISGTFIA